MTLAWGLQCGHICFIQVFHVIFLPSNFSAHQYRGSETSLLLNILKCWMKRNMSLKL